MVEDLPSRRPVYGRDHISARTPDDRERRAQARREAEALFAPKPAATESPVTAPTALARVLLAAPPPVQHETINAKRAPAGAIPATHVARIRTWVKYGMTIAQAAAVYGVDAGEIARLLSKV